MGEGEGVLVGRLVIVTWGVVEGTDVMVDCDIVCTEPPEVVTIGEPGAVTELVDRPPVELPTEVESVRFGFCPGNVTFCRGTPSVAHSSTIAVKKYIKHVLVSNKDKLTINSRLKS